MAYPIATFLLIFAMLVILYVHNRRIRQNTDMIVQLWRQANDDSG